MTTGPPIHVDTNKYMTAPRVEKKWGRSPDSPSLQQDQLGMVQYGLKGNRKLPPPLKSTLPFTHTRGRMFSYKDEAPDQVMREEEETEPTTDEFFTTSGEGVAMVD
uniref:Uncharacterized protein n=1 Tax=Cajanus cajan TaxID=3821 RepID=A0A151TEW7_CAJCA|nr:hypothetical protein KK1_011858 [Cajanus cajan]